VKPVSLAPGKVRKEPHKQRDADPGRKWVDRRWTLSVSKGRGGGTFSGQVGEKGELRTKKVRWGERTESEASIYRKAWGEEKL